MGTDIYTRNGIIFSIDDAVGRFFKMKKKDIATFVQNHKEEYPNLSSVKTINDLKQWFIDLANSKVSEDNISSTEILERIWEQIVSPKFELPSVSFEYFTSNRISGYDVPTQTVCLVFSDAGLFETKLTKEGKRVARIMGNKELQSTTWTVYSY